MGLRTTSLWAVVLAGPVAGLLGHAGQQQRAGHRGHRVDAERRPLVPVAQRTQLGAREGRSASFPGCLASLLRRTRIGYLFLLGSSSGLT